MSLEAQKEINVSIGLQGPYKITKSLYERDSIIHLLDWKSTRYIRLPHVSEIVKTTSSKVPLTKAYRPQLDIPVGPGPAVTRRAFHFKQVVLPVPFALIGARA